MTSTFRTAGPWGAGVGRPITWAEQDQNIYDKETRLNALENPATGSGPVSIDYISVSGNQMTIHMTDSSVQGPFELPTAAWAAQGQWLPSHLYHALDVVTYGGSAYLINADHTSDTTFDPGAMLGTIQLYTLLFSYAPAPGFEISTATFSPTLLNANGYIRLTHASGCAVTLDPATYETLPDWTEFSFRDASTDTGAFCTIAATSPATINPVPGYLNETIGKGSTFTVKKVGATDAWDLMGLLEAAP